MPTQTIRTSSGDRDIAITDEQVDLAVMALEDHGQRYLSHAVKVLREVIPTLTLSQAVAACRYAMDIRKINYKKDPTR